MKIHPYEGRFLVCKGKSALLFFNFYIDNIPSWTKRMQLAQRYTSEQAAIESIARIKEAGKQNERLEARSDRH